MLRHSGTNAFGKSFDSGTVEAVWNKAKISSRHNPLREDALGTLIWKEAYGNTNSKFGWEIDHIRAVTAGGDDDLSNLQPLQWQSKRQK
jgi:hypothetical protein